MTYVVVTITYFLLIGFLLWKNEAGTYIRHMTPHHLVCILKTSFSILTEVVLTMSLTFACVYTLCGLRKALPDEKAVSYTHLFLSQLDLYWEKDKNDL